MLCYHHSRPLSLARLLFSFHLPNAFATWPFPDSSQQAPRCAVRPSSSSAGRRPLLHQGLLRCRAVPGWATRPSHNDTSPESTQPSGTQVGLCLTSTGPLNRPMVPCQGCLYFCALSLCCPQSWGGFACLSRCSFLAGLLAGLAWYSGLSDCEKTNCCMRVSKQTDTHTSLAQLDFSGGLTHEEQNLCQSWAFCFTCFSHIS